MASDSSLPITLGTRTLLESLPRLMVMVTVLPLGALLPPLGDCSTMLPFLIYSSALSVLETPKPFFPSSATASASVIPTTSGTSMPSEPALTVRTTFDPSGSISPSVLSARITIPCSYWVLSSYSISGVSPRFKRETFTSSMFLPTTPIICTCAFSSCCSSWMVSS